MDPTSGEGNRACPSSHLPRPWQTPTSCRCCWGCIWHTSAAPKLSHQAFPDIRQHSQGWKGPLQPSAIQWGMPGATEIHLLVQHQGCPPQLSHPGNTTLCGPGAPGKQGMEPGCNRGWSGQGTGRTMQVMRLEGVTAAPGHMQLVPRATGLLFLDCLEETLLPDTAAPTEMKRPFSPCPFSLPVHARVVRTCAHPLHGAFLARPAPLPPANIFSNDPLLLLQTSPIVLQKSLKTQQLCFDEFA